LKNTKWQFGYIKNLISANHGADSYLKSSISRIASVNSKNRYLPTSLYKYYADTAYNAYDVREKKLWIASPNSFNDPFDCKIGFDSEKLEKAYLIRLIQKSIRESSELDTKKCFSRQDLHRIKSSYIDDRIFFRTGSEDYETAKSEIFAEKDERYRWSVEKVLTEKVAEASVLVNGLIEDNIRVACFSRLRPFYEFNKQISMWSHYSNNHKGFCVKFNIEELCKNLTLKELTVQYSNPRAKNNYFNERLLLAIKSGIFPVNYSSDRVSIPISGFEFRADSLFLKSKTPTEHQEKLYRSFLTKSTCWSYEREWRLILDKNVCSLYDNKIPFPYAESIYLGCRIDRDFRNLMIDVGADLGIPVYQMKLDSGKFKLEEASTYDRMIEKNFRWNSSPY